jgi:hypothetical protein
MSPKLTSYGLIIAVTMVACPVIETALHIDNRTSTRVTAIAIVTALALVVAMEMNARRSERRKQANAQAAAAGIRALLYADMSLDDILAGARLPTEDTPDNPWPRLSRANAQIKNGRPEEAVAILRSILAIPDLEARMRLFVWNALRGLGEQPDKATADVVRGVIADVSAGQGVDTLAVYFDGSLRYINHTGGMFIWELDEEPIFGLSRALIAEAQKAVVELPLVAERPSGPPRQARFVLLTDAGMRVGELADGKSQMLGNVFAAATRLFGAIVERKVRDEKTRGVPK